MEELIAGKEIHYENTKDGIPIYHSAHKKKDDIPIFDSSSCIENTKDLVSVLMCLVEYGVNPLQEPLGIDIDGGKGMKMLGQLGKHFFKECKDRLEQQQDDNRQRVSIRGLLGYPPSEGRK